MAKESQNDMSESVKDIQVNAAALEDTITAACKVESVAVSLADALKAHQDKKLDPYAIVATNNFQGQVVGLNRIELGEHISKNFASLGFMWQHQFELYHETHLMADVLNKLKAGLDDVSIYNIDHHEKLIHAHYAGGDALYHNNFLWNSIDRQLFERYKQMCLSGDHPFLKDVNLEWGSCYTNFYGLYDTSAEIIESINGKAIFDVGAYIGDSLSLFLSLFDKSVTYAFEPSSNNIEELKSLFADYIQKGVVVPVHKGLGREKKTIELSKMQGEVDAMASMQFDYKAHMYEKVEVITLDEYVKEHNLDVGLIKIDVEGYEPEVLAGAMNTIKEQRPTLIIAFYHTPYEFYEIKSYIESLNLDYSFAVRRSCLSTPLVDLVLICTPNNKA